MEKKRVLIKVINSQRTNLQIITMKKKHKCLQHRKVANAAWLWHIHLQKTRVPLQMKLQIKICPGELNYFSFI